MLEKKILSPCLKGNGRELYTRNKATLSGMPLMFYGLLTRITFHAQLKLILKCKFILSIIHLIVNNCGFNKGSRANHRQILFMCTCKESTKIEVTLSVQLRDDV